MTGHAAAALMIAWAASLARPASAATFTVNQQDRRFDVSQLTIAVGDTVHFTNNDEFTHQMYVVSPHFGYDSDEQNPGQGIDMKFTAAGRFTVQCHIHPRMALQVEVR